MKSRNTLLPVLIGIGVLSLAFAAVASAAIRSTITSAPPPVTTGSTTTITVSGQ